MNRINPKLVASFMFAFLLISIMYPCYPKDAKTIRFGVGPGGIITINPEKYKDLNFRVQSEPADFHDLENGGNGCPDGGPGCHPNGQTCASYFRQCDRGMQLKQADGYIEASYYCYCGPAMR